MKMNWRVILVIGVSLAAVAGLLAQESQIPSSAARVQTQSYDVAREINLVGTVISYTRSASSAPRGPRLSLQTSSGVVDVHLGDARLLDANKFTIQSGDTLRIIGENVSFNGPAQFVARIIQKGTQALTVRTAKGFPIAVNATSSGHKVSAL
jgi:hypothetical protein